MSSSVDRRSEVPDLVQYLLPHEDVINVEPVEANPFRFRVDPLQAFMRLTNAPTPDQIGDHGMAVGSREIDPTVTSRHLLSFECPFGRDAVRQALMTHNIYPKLLPATLKGLAERMAMRFDKRSSAERGRHIHEGRDSNDPIAIELFEKHGMKMPNCPQVDVNPLWIIGLEKHLSTSSDFGFLHEKYEGRDGKKHTIDFAFRETLGWMTRRMDKCSDGYLEFYPFFKGDHQIQVWRDSWDGYPHQDGTVSNPKYGIAALEAQALAYRALKSTERIYASKEFQELLKPKARSKYVDKLDDIRKRADHMKAVLTSDFYFEDELGSSYALGFERLEDGTK
jgi:hypothetical protein